jgi:hypothetical protein
LVCEDLFGCSLPHSFEFGFFHSGGHGGVADKRICLDYDSTLLSKQFPSFRRTVDASPPTACMLVLWPNITEDKQNKSFEK